VHVLDSCNFYARLILSEIGLQAEIVIDLCFFSVCILEVLLCTAIYCSSLTIDFDEGDS
jgi:hypothetical protein